MATPPLNRLPRPRRSPGSGVLPLLLILLLGSTLMLLAMNRALLFELRAAASQWRGTRAFESAEAGRHWLVAQLNRPESLDAACQPLASAGLGTPLRQRLLPLDAATGRLLPSGVAPGCAWDGQRWQCHCPASGTADLSAIRPATGPLDADLPSFVLRFVALPQPGRVRVQISGCSSPAGRCGASPGSSDAVVQIEVLLATLPLLPRPPAATLNAAGDIRLQGAVQVLNADPRSGATTLDAGGALLLDAGVQLLGPAGSPGGLASAVSNDPQYLDGSGLPLDDATLYAQFFGLGRARHQTLPVLQRLACRPACAGAAVTAALQRGSGPLWLDGDLQLDGTARWGSTTQPLLLIVDGRATLNGPLQLAGLLHVRELDWRNDSAEPGLLQGAIVSTGPLQAAGHLLLQHDRALLERLALGSGVLLPVPGSWRDFSD